MTGLLWSYSADGTPTSFTIDVPGPNDLRIGVKGIDRNEASAITREAGKMGTDNPAIREITVDGKVSYFEEAKMRLALNDKMREMGITGSITGVSLTRQQQKPSSDISNKVQSIFNSVTGSLTSASGHFEKSTGNNPSANGYQEIEFEKDSVTLHTGKYQMHVSLKGLSAEEASQLERYLTAHPQEQEALRKLAHDIAEDGKLTAKESALANTVGENLFIKSGITADIGHVKVGPS